MCVFIISCQLLVDCRKKIIYQLYLSIQEGNRYLFAVKSKKTADAVFLRVEL
jgi:hypothetical protein